MTTRRRRGYPPVSGGRNKDLFVAGCAHGASAATPAHCGARAAAHEKMWPSPRTGTIRATRPWFAAQRVPRAELIVAECHADTFCLRIAQCCRPETRVLKPRALASPLVRRCSSVSPSPRHPTGTALPPPPDHPKPDTSKSGYVRRSEVRGLIMRPQSQNVTVGGMITPRDGV